MLPYKQYSDYYASAKFLDVLNRTRAHLQLHHGIKVLIGEFY
ncbi:MAG: hypothetical protein ON057_001860 [Glomeribacter sp. 1016415]|nr:hypothetical protein [Glomeribacter sp. 1016415]